MKGFSSKHIIFLLIRLVIGPENILFAGVCARAFRPGNILQTAVVKGLT